MRCCSPWPQCAAASAWPGRRSRTARSAWPNAPSAELAGWLARLAPAEVIVDRDLPAGSVDGAATTITRRPPWQFDSALGHRMLCTQLRVASLAAFGADELAAAHAAAGALLAYAEHTQGRALAHIHRLRCSAPAS